MGTGYGKIGRAIAAAFKAQPDAEQTLRSLAALCYPDHLGEPTRVQLKAVSRAAAKVSAEMGWRHSQRGSNRSRFGKRQTIFVRPEVSAGKADATFQATFNEGTHL